LAFTKRAGALARTQSMGSPAGNPQRDAGRRCPWLAV